MERSSRWRRLSVNLALMLVSTLLVLAVFEIVARRDLRYRAGKERRERVAYTQFDPVLGWRQRPNSRVRYERGEYSTEVVINSLGMRDRERTLTPSPGTFRVLALGDSFVEGYTVAFDETVGQVLERALDSPGCPIEVINAGSGGYSTDQEYLLYRESARRLGARVVLLFFFHNDVAPLLTDNYYGAPKPRFLAIHDDLRLETDHIKEPPPRPAPTPTPQPTIARKGKRWRLRSAILPWLSVRLSTGAPRLHETLANWGLWDHIDRSPVHPEMKVFHRRPSPRTIEAWAVVDHLLVRLKRDVEADGARLIVVYIPSRMEVDERDWQAACIQYSLKPGRWSRETVVRRLEQSGRHGGFPVFDLTPALRAASAGLRGRTYLEIDRHWNAHGHRVAGEAVASYLRGAGLLPECVRPR
jgi:hypothetical protein